MKRPLSVLMAGLALSGATAAYDSAERFETKNVCTFIAGVTTRVPPEEDGDAPHGRLGVYDRDGLMMQGMLDLDGDGVFETVKNGDMGRHGGDLFDIQMADGNSVLEGGNTGRGDEPAGYGAGFMSFTGRWYMLTFTSEGGAFATGAYAFDKGVKRKLVCKFETTAVEDMQNGTGGTDVDNGWCGNAVIEEAKAKRLKPAITLTDAQSAALVEMMGEYAGNSTYKGNEIFKPSAGPLAGKLLWKVYLVSDAGHGCKTGSFYLVEADGAGGYKIAEDDAGRKMLNLLQSGHEAWDSYNCHSDANAFEKDGRFFVEQSSGEDAPRDDAMLHHTINEFRDGKAQQICTAVYELTTKVTWSSPDLPQ